MEEVWIVFIEPSGVRITRSLRTLAVLDAAADHHDTFACPAATGAGSSSCGHHRPTIERRLQQLLDDQVAFASGGVDLDFNNQLNWVTRIRVREVWDRLTKASAPGASHPTTMIMRCGDRLIRTSMFDELENVRRVEPSQPVAEIVQCGLPRTNY